MIKIAQYPKSPSIPLFQRGKYFSSLLMAKGGGEVHLRRKRGRVRGQLA